MTKRQQEDRNAKALRKAIRHGDLANVLDLLSSGDGEKMVLAAGLGGHTPLMLASRKDNIAVVRALIQWGSDVNASTPSGLTPLTLAAYMGQIPIVQELVKAGADVNIQGKGGWTALMRAAHGGSKKMVQELILAKAHVNGSDQRGVTPLMWAAMSGAGQVIDLLITSGANVQAVDDDGWSALVYALRHGETKSIQRLVEAGSNVNAVDKKGGVTVLMHGAGCPECVVSFRDLATRVKSLDAVDDQGWSALMHAAEEGNFGAVHILVELGAKTGLKDREKQDAESLARGNDHIECASLLRCFRERDLLLGKSTRKSSVPLSKKRGRTL